MIMISIAPLSINRCYQGRRFKTPEYKVYEQELLLKLARYNIDIPDKIKLTIEAGISAQMDIDNVAKPLIDILQTRYKFNDRDIYDLHLIKKVTKDKYLKIQLEELT